MEAKVRNLLTLWITVTCMTQIIDSSEHQTIPLFRSCLYSGSLSHHVWPILRLFWNWACCGKGEQFVESLQQLFGSDPRKQFIEKLKTGKTSVQKIWERFCNLIQWGSEYLTRPSSKEFFFNQTVRQNSTNVTSRPMQHKNSEDR